MDLDATLAEIRNGLTGDREADRRYLVAQTERWRESDRALEILREIGRMMYELMPPEARDEFQEALKGDEELYRQGIDAARVRHEQGDLEGAGEILKGLIIPFDRLPLEDTHSVYRRWANRLQEEFLRSTVAGDKELRPMVLLREGAVRLLALVRTQQGRHAEALALMDGLIERCPLEMAFRFERAEILRGQGEIDRLEREIQEAMPLCYGLLNLARWFRTLGYCRAHREKWDEARVCLLSSLTWEDHPMARSELGYIDEKSGQKTDPQAMAARALELLDSAGAPPVPDTRWLQLAYDLANRTMTEGDLETAELALAVVAELTQSEQAARLYEEVRARRTGAATT